MPSATSDALSSVRTVAVVRALAGIGDMLCAVPALRSLRAGLPDAHVALIGLPSSREFVARFPGYLDELIGFPGFPGIPEVPPSVTALPAFLAGIQARGFDLALQMQGSGFASNPFTVLLGAARVSGLYLPGQYRPGEEFVAYPADRHESQRLTALTSALGMPDTGEHLEWPVTAADRAGLARAAEGRLARGYALIHPGASQETRRWPAERFAAVADRLVRAGLQVVISGATGDRSLARRVVARMSRGENVFDLTGRTSLGELGALVEGARLVVTNDTGVSHLAAALRRPSVVVFSASDPRRWAPLDSELHIAIHGEPSTARCETERGLHERCLRDGCRELDRGARGDEVGFMDVEPVLDAVELQLGREDERVA